jgi:hypothetical protein
VQQRAEEYAQRRAKAEATRVEVAELVDSGEAKPAPRQVPWNRLVAAFLEEKNIRWGELVGGLLIVSCSIALVISFWSAIAERPFLKFGVLNGVTASLFALGLYAARRWKLPTTSQGILITSTLLVPLNFLAIAAFADVPTQLTMPILAGELLSSGLLAALVFLASKLIVPDWRWSLTIGVVVPSVCQLAIRRYVSEDAPLVVLYAFCLVGLLVSGAVHAVGLPSLLREGPIPERRANELLKRLGLVSFSLLVALGLLLVKSQYPRETLQWLSPLSMLAAMPLMGCGVLLWLRPAAELPSYRIVGAALSVLSVFILLAGLVLAWPQPALVTALCACCCLVMLAIAVVLPVPQAYTVAALALSPAIVITAHVFAGRLAWSEAQGAVVTRALLSGLSGRVLTVVALVGLLISQVMLRLRRGDVARAYFWAGIVDAVLGLALVCVFGFGRRGDPEYVTWIVGIYAVVAVVIAIRAQSALAMAAAGALLLGTLGQHLAFGDHGWNVVDARLVVPVVHSLLLLTLAGWLSWRPADLRTSLYPPLRIWICVTSLAAAGLIVVKLFEGTPLAEWYGLLVLTLLSLSITWGGLAWLDSAPAWFAVSQTALIAAGLAWIDQQISRQAWFDQSPWARIYPQSLQCHAIWLSSFATAWMMIRRLTAAARPTARRLSEAAESAGSTSSESRRPAESHERTIVVLSRLVSLAGMKVDVIAGVLAGLLLVALSVYGVVPGVAQELSPRLSVERIVPSVENFLWQGIPHDSAYGWATWILALILSVVCIGYLSIYRRSIPRMGLAVVSSTVPLLLASRFHDTVSVASALRWFCALYLFAASAVVWFRRPLGRWGQRVGWLAPGPLWSDRMIVFATLVSVSTAPLVGMALFVSLSALYVQPPSPADWQAWFWTWLIASAGGLGLLVTWVAARQPRPRDKGWAIPAASSLFVLAASPLIAVTLFVIGNSLAEHPVIGPDVSSWFQRIGLAASYAIPLLMVSAALAGNAISYRSHGIAFAGGMLLNVAAIAAYLLSLKSGSLTADQWIRLSQLNAIVASLYGLVWCLVAERLSRPLHDLPVPAAFPRNAWKLLWVQRGISAGFFLLPVVAAMGALLADWTLAITIHRAADVWGWLGLIALTLFAWIGLHPRLSSRWPQMLVWPVTVGLIMLALGIEGIDIGRPAVDGWTASLHAMQVALFTSAVLVIVVQRWSDAGRSIHADGSSVPGVADSADLPLVIGGALPLLGLIAYSTAVLFHYSGAGRWQLACSIAGLVAAALLCIDRGCFIGRQRWWFLAAMVFNLAASVWWAEYGSRMIGGRAARGFREFLCTNVIAAAAPVPIWVALTVRRMQPGRRRTSVHGAAMAIAIGLLLMLCLAGLGDQADHAHPLMAWLAFAAVAVAGVSTLWDRRLSWTGIALYLISLLAVGTVLDQLDLPTSLLLWSGTLMLSAHGVATSYVWSRREEILAALRPWGVSPKEGNRPVNTAGLVTLNSILSAVVCGLGTWIQLTEPNPAQRLAASQAVIAQSIAVGLLAHGRRASMLRYGALLIAVVGAVLFGWSWLRPESSWLDRMVVTSCALMGMAVFYAIGLIKIVRRENDWTAAAGRLVPPLLVAGAMSVVGVLTVEVGFFVTRGEVPISRSAMIAVAIALIASAVACLVAAVVPGRDPLGLSQRQRMGYVYAAEALLAVLFAHLRVCVPELFAGLAQKYWTLIVMGLAFLGVGLSEFFRRRRHDVLAEPLERTGAVLPLLPVIGFWVGTGEVHYSLIMLAAGGLYATLSLMRRSFGFGVLAALAANGGLWYFLESTADIRFFSHPQLWLIPPAVCMLVAAYLNRHQLNEAQMTSIRYVTSAVIYASSTADIFINGVAQAPWLPFVLAGISLAGIFAGIMLRVRAFLFLGLAFLGIALFTVVWHAAVDLQQTWLWYVSGIVTGVLIIALFALFERKRQDVLRVVDQLKTWER